MKYDYIACGDSFELIKSIPDNSIDLIVTDPPYLISKNSNFDKGGSWNDLSNKAHRKTPPKTDFGDWDKQELNFFELIKQFYRVLRWGGSCLIFFDIWKMQELKELADAEKFKQPRLIKWEKTNPVPVNSKLNYLSNATEYCFTCVKGSKPTFNSEYDKGIYTYPICSGIERTIHPTQKPLNLIQDLILKHSNENDIVFDPFLGSGTTAVASAKLNRHYIGFELNEEYFNIAQKRLTEISNDVTAITENQASIEENNTNNKDKKLNLFTIANSTICDY